MRRKKKAASKQHSVEKKLSKEELIGFARKALECAYAPYTGFKVGAALLTKEGKVFTGSNVENVSSGLSLCAERVAVLKAVSEGYRNFVHMTVVADISPVCKPCGSCRQVLYEFNPSMKLTLANLRGERLEVNVKDLLPKPFRLREVPRKEEERSK